MPSASSTFSDRSARNSSAVSDSVIDRSAAVIVDAIGAPSSSSSKPSAAGAATSIVPVGSRHADAAVEQELDRRGQLAALVDRASLLVTHLAAEARQPEQLVDVREIEERDLAQAIGELDRRQRLLPELLAALDLDAIGGQCPRRRFEHVLIAHVAMREDVLQIVGERPHPAFFDEHDRSRRNRLIFVMQQLGDRVFDVARAGPVDDVALADALLRRHFVDEQHDPLS